MAVSARMRARFAGYRTDAQVLLRPGPRPVRVVDRRGYPRSLCGCCGEPVEREWCFCPECAQAIGWVQGPHPVRQ